LSSPNSLGKIAAVVALAAAAGLAAWVWLPPRPEDDLRFSTLLTDRDGKLLRFTTAPDGRYRLWVPLEGYSSTLIEAVLLKEDRAFWYHPGVNPAALLSGAWHTWVARDYRAGASTLTMQLARLLYRLDTDQPAGKLAQMALAFRLTLLHSKRDILELYLNLAPCGGNVEGIGTAARIDFNKDPASLNLAEALTLAVLPQAPGNRNPRDPASTPAIEAARNRLFVAWAAVHPEAGSVPPEGPRYRLTLPFEAPHFSEAVLASHPTGKTWRTTLDLGLQGVVERKVDQFLDRVRPRGVKNAAVLLVKADTMEVLAHLGSADFHDPSIDGQVDGTAAPRSPGSTWKPFLYALALEQGLIHPATVLKDARVHFGGYNPDNFDNDFEGPIRASEALVKSRNVPAVLLAQKLKDPDLYDWLVHAGIRLPFTRQHYGLSIVLGGAETTMSDLVRLYGTLANEGTTRPLKTVTTESTASPTRLLTAPAAYLVRQILESKPRPDEDQYAPGALSRRPVAYKTGTSIGFRDAWSVGVFDNLILAVWVGDFRNGSNQEFVGLRTAAPLMFELVDALRAGKEAGRYQRSEADPVPPEIVQVRVCTVSGGLATPLCPHTELSPFIAGVSPAAPCSVHQSVWVDKKTGLRVAQEVPGKTRQEVYEIWPAEILQVFQAAGLARRTPPAWAPGEGAPEAPAGNLPTVLSPVAGMEYWVRLGDADQRVPFVSSAGSDVHTVFWFVDGALVGTAPRGTAYFWAPTPGHHTVKAVDDLGRTASAEFSLRTGL